MRRIKYGDSFAPNVIAITSPSTPLDRSPKACVVTAFVELAGTEFAQLRSQIENSYPQFLRYMPYLVTPNLFCIARED